jgi:uncharacterized protein YbjT (DUF2867 family)
MSYAVIGATGNTGKWIVESLLAHGADVKAVGRTEAKLAPLAKLGATMHIGSILDTAFLSRVFTGVKAVYAMIPPNLTVPDFREYQKHVGESIVAALRGSTVTHVVNLSSQGADLEAGTGPIAGLHDQEQRLNAVAGLNVVHLRATFFMENLLQNIPMIKAHGIVATPLFGDLPMAMIATRDIADMAARYLLSLNFHGQGVQDLLGPNHVTMREATLILGKAIGRPDLRYMQSTYGDTEKAMLASGISPGVARSFVEMYQAFNDGLITMPVRSAGNSTSTTLIEFATLLTPMFGL